MQNTLIYQYTNIQSGDVMYSMWEDRFEDEIHTGHVCQRSFPIDDFEDYVEAISPVQQEPVSWQPISTAPRDGTTVLCLGHGGTPFICNYENGSWRRAPHSKRIVGLTHWISIPAMKTLHLWS